MATSAFSTLATNPVPAQPVSPGSKIVFRSSDATDSLSIEARGVVGASPDTDTIALAGLVESQSADTFVSVTQAIIDAAPVGTVTALAPGVAAAGDIAVLAQPYDGLTLFAGLVGFTVAYRFKNTLAQAFDVQIGATTADTAANLKAAINADGTPGTEYYTGTTAHPQLSAAVATTVVTITDRIACERQLAWQVTEQGTAFAKRIPRDGADGLTLFSFAPGVTECADGVTFDSENRTTTTLPALLTATCGYVPVNGSQAMYRIYSNATLTGKFQWSTDLTNWHDTAEGSLSITSGEAHANFSELHEYLRFVLTANANTTAKILDVKVIY